MKHKTKRIVSKREQEILRNTGSLDPTLPPPGAARHDELKRRQDALEAEAELMNADAGTIDPAALEPDLAILTYVNELAVEGAVAGKAYCWVNPLVQSGYFVRLKEVLSWEVVRGDMPECPRLKDATGFRRLGDVILMRVDAARALAIDRHYQQLSERRMVGVTGNLKEMAAKHAGKGVILHLTGEDLDLDHPIIKRAIQKAAARQVVLAGPVTQMLKEGRVPGIPAAA
jgi:hypothetical protein